MNGLAEFLLARIVEDEAVVAEYIGRCGALTGRESGDYELMADSEYCSIFIEPQRVLAECEAKRRIVEAHPVIRGERVLAVDSSGTDFGCQTCHCIDPINDGIVEAIGWCETVLALALPYADHPDYLPEWRPAPGNDAG